MRVVHYSTPVHLNQFQGEQFSYNGNKLTQTTLQLFGSHKYKSSARAKRSGKDLDAVCHIIKPKHIRCIN